jgi:membrane-associated phospholipid phosphatase
VPDLSALGLAASPLASAVAPAVKILSAPLGLTGVLVALTAVNRCALSVGPLALGEADPAGSKLPRAEHLFRIAAILFGIFIALAFAIHWSGVAQVDRHVGAAFYRSGSAGVTEVMRAVSGAGGGSTAILWIPLIVAALVLKGRARALRFFLPALFGILALETFFKPLIGRVRPETAFSIHSFSFPSGHTLGATILAGALLAVLLPACRAAWQRWALCFTLPLWPLVTAASRVYLGAHYLTDVVAGLALGTAWVCCCLGVLLRRPAASLAKALDV